MMINDCSSGSCLLLIGLVLKRVGDSRRAKSHYITESLANNRRVDLIRFHPQLFVSYYNGRLLL